MAEHTPTPWEVQPFSEEEAGVGIIGLRTDKNGAPYPNPTNGLVAWATMHPTEIDANDGSRAAANAAFIVKAVNNHDALVKALVGYERFITLMHEMAGENGYKSGIALAQERCRKELDHIDAAMTAVRDPVGSETERGK